MDDPEGSDTQSASEPRRLWPLVTAIITALAAAAATALTTITLDRIKSSEQWQIAESSAYRSFIDQARITRRDGQNLSRCELIFVDVRKAATPYVAVNSRSIGDKGSAFGHKSDGDFCPLLIDSMAVSVDEMADIVNKVRARYDKDYLDLEAAFLRLSLFSAPVVRERAQSLFLQLGRVDYPV